MISPFPHQKKSIDEIFDKFTIYDKVLYQLPTGGGKTFVFSFITQAWSKMYGGKVLILCHRTELIQQTIGSLNQIGVTCEAVTSKTKQCNHAADCYVAMVETAYNRLEKNPFFFKDVRLTIVDECHLQLFSKVFSHFKGKLLGCTATPIVYKRITFYKCSLCKAKYDVLTQCCDTEAVEWSRPFTMSEIYDDIVVGASIGELIEMGNLVQDINFAKDYADLSHLTIDAKTGDFTNESMDEAYNDKNAVFNVLLNYEEICKGKKTMIFNSTAKSNKLIYDKFIEAGYTNVRMYDSVNCKSSERKSVVDWFKSNQDAVLLNVGVFTTGFDDTTVEAIMVNRATNSLSLWLQIVGRGGRSSKLIYKDKFIVVDGGENILRHNEWSDASRDWKKIFFEGLGGDREKSKKVALEDVQACDGCGYLMPKTIDKCPECGFVIPPPSPRPIKEGTNIVVPIKNIPPPNGEKIYLYTKSQQADLNFAWRILINQIYDMFVFYRVSTEAYNKSKASGELNKKIKKMITSCYFVLKSKSDIESGVERTINYLIQKVLKKLEERYGN